MNALIGNRPLPAYYDTGAQTKPSDVSEDDSTAVEAAIQKDPANNLLLILWADPALTAIPKRRSFDSERGVWHLQIDADCRCQSLFNVLHSSTDFRGDC